MPLTAADHAEVELAARLRGGGHPAAPPAAPGVRRGPVPVPGLGPGLGALGSAPTLGELAARESVQPPVDDPDRGRPGGGGARRPGWSIRRTGGWPGCTLTPGGSSGRSSRAGRRARTPSCASSCTGWPEERASGRSAELVALLERLLVEDHDRASAPPAARPSAPLRSGTTGSTSPPSSSRCRAPGCRRWPRPGWSSTCPAAASTSGSWSASSSCPCCCSGPSAGWSPTGSTSARLLYATQARRRPAGPGPRASWWSPTRSQLWQVYLLAALLGVVNVFDNPARQTFVMEMVGRDDSAQRGEPQHAWS